jgi:hypothetical protein
MWEGGQKKMAKHSGILIGTAGVYYVASQLAMRGFNAAVTYGNAPSVDILVGLPDGSATLSLQVKTSAWAWRTRGRGQNKKPHHYEWEIGKSAKSHRSDLFFVLVDLKQGTNELPDVFIIPSKIMSDWYRRTVNDLFHSQEDKWIRKRYHPKVEEVEKYKNNWSILKENLNEKSRSSEK